MGPQQVGKTSLARQVMKSYKNPLHLNYDNIHDRKVIEQQNWHPNVDLLVFDEIQKRDQWKTHIKGVFDTRKKGLHILVVGSARLHALSKSGDSLVGRYFPHTLLPFSSAELLQSKSQKNLSHLLARGGFPEPLLKLSAQDAKRWRMQYLDSLLRGDLLDMQYVHNHHKMKLLVELLMENVTSPLSLQSLSRNLQLAHGTLTKYISILENLYLIFKITPFSKNISRSLLKAPKIYFYDSGLISEESARLENLIALSLFKHCQFLKETKGIHLDLYFLRTKDGKEIDFCLADKKKAKIFIEIKKKDTRISSTLEKMSKKYKVLSKQVVLEFEREGLFKGVLLEKAEHFLKSL